MASGVQEGVSRWLAGCDEVRIVLDDERGEPMRLVKLRRRGTDDQRIRRVKKWTRRAQWRLIWNHFPTVARMFPLPRQNGPLPADRGAG